jgi:hypothetical protein
MDLLSTNAGAIAEGNARMKAVQEFNQRVNDHNDQIANQISSLKTQQDIASIGSQAKEALAGAWTGRGIPDKIQAYKDWKASVSKGTNPDDAGRNSVSANADPDDEPLFDEPAPPGGVGQEAEEESKSLTSRLSGISDETLDTVGKGIGTLGAVGTAGFDIYKDFSDGKPHLAGDNWASKASNALQIGGAIADVGGLAFPPLALAGGVADLLSAGAGEIGDLLDLSKEKTEDDKTAQSQQETTIAQPAEQIQSTARVY